MLTYTAAELEAMRETDKYKYYYYKDEEFFRDKLGINLDNPNWDSVVFAIGEPMKPGQDKYEYFYNTVRGYGIRFLSPEGDLMSLMEEPEDPTRERFQIRKLASHRPEKVQTEEEYFKEKTIPEEIPAPSFGFFNWIMRFITFGSWNKKGYEMYCLQRDAREAAESQRANGRIAYRTNVVEPVERDAAEIAEMEKKLDARGSSAEKRAQYRAAENRRIGSEREDRKACENNKHTVNAIVEGMPQATERLDYLMGPVQSPEKAKAGRENVLRTGMPEEDLATIPELKVPEGVGLDAHEIAVLGYAAFCTGEVIRKGTLQSDPTQPVPQDELTLVQKMNADNQWYINTEALFTHRIRSDASFAVPYVTYAKAELSQALAEYAAGDAGKLAGFLKEAIVYNTQFVMFQNNATDDTSVPDYCKMVHEMLAFCDRHTDIRDAVGLTADELRDAQIVNNMAEIWQRGTEAEKRLAATEAVTKPADVADIMALRLMQSTMAGLSAEITNSEKYQQAQIQLVAEAADVEKQAKMTRTDADRAKLADANMVMGVFITNGVAIARRGVQVESNANVQRLLGGYGAADRLRAELVATQEVESLCSCSNDEILMRLMPGKATKHLDGAAREINKKNEPRQPSAAPAKENVVSRSSSAASL